MPKSKRSDMMDFDDELFTIIKNRAELDNRSLREVCLELQVDPSYFQHARSNKRIAKKVLYGFDAMMGTQLSRPFNPEIEPDILETGTGKRIYKPDHTAELDKKRISSATISKGLQILEKDVAKRERADRLKDAVQEVLLAANGVGIGSDGITIFISYSNEMTGKIMSFSDPESYLRTNKDILVNAFLNAFKKNRNPKYLDWIKALIS